MAKLLFHFCFAAGLSLGLSGLWAQDLGLGKIHFPTSGQAAAQAPFLEGVLLLHSFEYEDAAEAFQEARRLDPNFAMAYWGEAMTHNHPIWHRQYPEPARKVLQAMGDSPEARRAKAPTQKEKDFLQAVEILYGEGSKEARDHAYSNWLQQMHEAYPDDHEVASFYALSLLGKSHNDRDPYLYMKAASIVEEVYAENPLHPGALHYLIHSYDDPVHACLGMRAARRYAQVAPAAAHALHMPSHIFIALGLWEEVVASNEASSAAADARRARKDLSVKARGFHSLHWLEYGYLQQGRFEDARRLLRDMERDAQDQPNGRVQYHLVAMRASFLIDSEHWEDPIFAREPIPKNLSEKAQAMQHFTTGYVAAMRAKPEITEKMIGRLEGLLPETLAHMDHDAAQPDQCCAPSTTVGGRMTPGVRMSIEIMRDELKALLRWQAGERAAAIEQLSQLAEKESGMSFMFGPPSIVKPTHELLGEWLLAEGKAEAAQAAFEAALKRAPLRSRSLLGLWQAAQQSGNEALSQRVEDQLSHNLRQADKTAFAQLKR